MQYNTALIIDDDPLFQVVAREILLSAGISSVETADDGVEGIRKVVENRDRFDLIISDLQMPNLNGVGVIRELAELGYSGTVIIVSGEDDGLIRSVHNMGRMLGVRISGALRKPINYAHLNDLLGLKQTVAHEQPSTCYNKAEVEDLIRSEKLRPYYQPKVDIRTNRINGFEVLARLEPSGPNANAPMEFLRAVEAHNLMTELTVTMIERAARETSGWLAHIEPFKLAFNVSPSSVEDLILPELMLDAAKKCHLDPNRIVFEITEDKLLKNCASTLEVLSRLRLARFGLSIDDFGTGATSMEQLRLYPFTELKIDRKFVQAATEDEFSRMTVETSTKLAAMLGIKVTAEGVENQDALALVAETGAHEVQGFHYSKALSPREALDWSRSFYHEKKQVA